MEQYRGGGGAARRSNPRNARSSARGTTRNSPYEGGELALVFGNILVVETCEILRVFLSRRPSLIRPDFKSDGALTTASKCARSNCYASLLAGSGLFIQCVMVPRLFPVPAVQPNLPVALATLEHRQMPTQLPTHLHKQRHTQNIP